MGRKNMKKKENEKKSLFSLLLFDWIEKWEERKVYGSFVLFETKDNIVIYHPFYHFLPTY